MAQANANTTDLLVMTVRELKTQCRLLEMRCYSRKRKAQLIDMITNYNNLSNEDKKKAISSPQTKLYNECKQLIEDHNLDIELKFLHDKGSGVEYYRELLIVIGLEIYTDDINEPEEKKEPEIKCLGSPYYSTIDNSITVPRENVMNETEEAIKILIATKKYKNMEYEALESIIEKFNMNNFLSLTTYIKISNGEYTIKLIKKLKKRKKHIEANLNFRKTATLEKRHNDKMLRMAEIQLKKRHNDKIAKMEKLRLEHAIENEQKEDDEKKIEIISKVREDIIGIPNLIPSPKSSPKETKNFKYPNNSNGIGFDFYGRYVNFFTKAMKEAGKKFKTYKEAKDEITRLFIYNFDYRNDPEEYKDLMSKIEGYHKSHSKLFDKIVKTNHNLNIRLLPIKLGDEDLKIFEKF